MEYLSSISRDDDYVEEVHPNLWLMADHRWAFWIWEKCRLEQRFSPAASLVHVDYHYDAIDDFHCAPGDDCRQVDALVELFEEDLSGLYRMVRENHLIRHDSFIFPAVIRGTIRDVHFHCRQQNTDPGFYWLPSGQHCARQYLHAKASEMIKAVRSENLILDIDLDFFNTSNSSLSGDIWPTPLVVKFVETIASVVSAAKVVTIAMSFLYSGSEEDTRCLAQTVVREVSHFMSN